MVLTSASLDSVASVLYTRAVEAAKRDPLAFVLWKAAKTTEPDDAKWPSPYGTGRPGCSPPT